MNLKPALAAGSIAAMAMLAFNASAAENNAGNAKADQAAPHMQKAAPHKKMKPHSHAEEKTGFPQKTPEAMKDKPDAAKDTSKHFHPRDGK